MAIKPIIKRTSDGISIELRGVRLKTLDEILALAGLGMLAWLAWGYFFLALLTSRIPEGVGIGILFEGFLRCLLSLPGIAGILLAATGAALLKHPV